MENLETGFLEPTTPKASSDKKKDDHIWVGFPVKNTATHPDAVKQYLAIEEALGIGRGDRSAFVKEAVHSLIKTRLQALAASKKPEEPNKDSKTTDKK